MTEFEADGLSARGIKHIAHFEARLIEGETARIIFLFDSPGIGHGDAFAAGDAGNLRALGFHIRLRMVAIGNGSMG